MTAEREVETGAVKPKKVLGQHFLKNAAAVAKSIEALNVKAGETIIEIGPGTGALTLPLAAHCEKSGARLIAIEKDEALAKKLQLPHARIIAGDVLHELPRLTPSLGNYKIIGNIPYYITGHLLRTISELPHKPSITVLMIQKEVAERVCAAPGRMNLLAAATQAWATPKILLMLKPQDFEPAPSVDSAIITLSTLLPPPVSTVELPVYFSGLHRIFKQPRKMLINNISEAGLTKKEAAELIAAIGASPTSRPQDLTVTQCAKIADALPR